MPRLALLLFLAAALAGCDALSGAEPGTAEVDDSRRLFPAVQNGDHVLIDETGRVVVSLDDYNETEPGAEGLVPARRWDGRNVWDFYDADGAVAFSVPADEAWAPRGGLARVRVDGRYGFVDLEGRYVVNPGLNSARDFSEGHARVKTTGWRYGLMDPSGTLVVEPQWDDLHDLRDGRARFEDDDLYGFIDATGAEVVPAAYEDARDFSGGRAAVRQGQRWFYIDAADARPMGSTTFISAGDFAEGLAPVRTENLWEYVDEGGQRAIEPRFQEARAFRDGRAAVQIDGLWTFIRPDGTLLREPEFDAVEDFAGGLAAVYVGEELGYIDREGETVWFPRD
jgi:hypothetical protein